MPGLGQLAGRKDRRAIFADYDRINIREVVPLPADATAADSPSMIVNRLTALTLVVTARRATGKRPWSIPPTGEEFLMDPTMGWSD